jgi:hypothetical protein
MGLKPYGVKNESIYLLLYAIRRSGNRICSWSSDSRDDDQASKGNGVDGYPAFSISRGDCIPPVLHESYALKYAVRALPLDKT